MEPLTRAAGDGVADPATVRGTRTRPVQNAPAASVWIGIDARVGGTAADFVNVSPPGAHIADADSVVIETPLPAKSRALVRVPAPGFAGTLQRAIVPAQHRLSNEVDRLGQIRSAALDYLKGLPAPSNEGGGDR